MNLAICISGHLRCYKKALSSLNELREILAAKFDSVDLFLATWDQIEAESSWAKHHGLHSDNRPTETSDVLAFRATQAQVFDDGFFSSQWSPLQQNLFGAQAVERDSRTHYNGINHVVKMAWLANQCLYLKNTYAYRNNNTYDFVIASRPEAIYNLNFFRALEPQNYKWNKNFVCAKIVTLDPPYPAILDRAVFGDEEGANHYLNAVYHLRTHFKNGEWPSGEVLRAQTLIDMNVQIINSPEIAKLTNDKNPNFLR